MKTSTFGLALIVVLAAVLPCRAETLDDDSIKKLYADTKAAIHDPDKTRELMETRLDENFTSRSNMTRSMAGTPPQTATETKSKSQAIEAEIGGLKEVNLESYDNAVVSIKYAPDRKSAIVNDTSTATGTVNAPSQPGQAAAIIRYTAKESCSNTLALVDAQIKIMQSDCNDQIVFKN
ncbi:MAG: hypothetical protein M3N08_01540 [Pseudomonadota bacterium]|nr:hypothetical protein [Pseudomonadota bacterium]